LPGLRVRYGEVMALLRWGAASSQNPHTDQMSSLQRHIIHTVDGPVRFLGRKLTQKSGRVRLPGGPRAATTVTVYVTDGGDGIIQEDFRVDGQRMTFVSTVHAGTSPDWHGLDKVSRAGGLPEAAWAAACAAEPSLRPVRRWAITEDYEERRIPTGPDTHMVIRSRWFV
jgi:hypothetical protein